MGQDHQLCYWYYQELVNQYEPTTNHYRLHSYTPGTTDPSSRVCAMYVLMLTYPHTPSSPSICCLMWHKYCKQQTLKLEGVQVGLLTFLPSSVNHCSLLTSHNAGEERGLLNQLELHQPPTHIQNLNYPINSRFTAQSHNCITWFLLHIPRTPTDTVNN